MFQGLLAGFKSLFSGSPPPGESKGLDQMGFRERRKLVRLRCSYEVRVVHKGKKFKATIVDVGVQGLKLRTGQRLAVGDKVELAPPGPIQGTVGNPVEGKVVWTKAPGKGYSQYAGVLFVTKKEEMGQSWIKLFLRELGFTPKSIFTHRRFVRADCFLDARYKPPEASREIIGRVYNLGVGGMLLESPYDLPMKEPVVMEFLPPEGLKPMRLTGYPIKAKREGTMRLICLEFRNLNDDELEQLGRYLKQLLKASFND